MLIFPIGTGFIAPWEIFPRLPTGRLFSNARGEVRNAQVLRAQCAHFARFARVLRVRLRAHLRRVFPVGTGFQRFMQKMHNII